MREGMHLKNQIWRDRHGQLDVAHALAADAGEGHLDAATVADDAAVLDALVLAAGAFPVLDGAEDAFAEQAAFFGLERAVIDGLGVLDLSLGPGPDGVGRRDGNRDVLHLVDLVQPEQFPGAFFGANHTISILERVIRASNYTPARADPGSAAAWSTGLE